MELYEHRSIMIRCSNTKCSTFSAFLNGILQTLSDYDTVRYIETFDFRYFLEWNPINFVQGLQKIVSVPGTEHATK